MRFIRSTIAFFLSLFPPVAEEGVAQSTDLGPLYEPGAVRFSFDTPGWYFLAVLFIAFMSVIIIKRVKHYKKNAYRRKALKEIEAIEKRYHRKQNNSSINDVLILVRSVAITAFGRKSVAPLYGEKWLQFLESKGKDTPFTQHTDFIFQAIYKDNADDQQEIGKVMKLSKKWIETHA